MDSPKRYWHEGARRRPPAGPWTLAIGVGHGQYVDMVTQRITRHAMRRLPRSRVGWWAVALAGLTLASVVLLLLAIASGIVGYPRTFTGNWVVTGWGLSVWATAMACLVAGIVAITRRHERSWMVLLATFVGLLPIALLLSEAALGKA
jgi:hypothetical protein